MNKDLYAILELSKGASDSDIKRSYKKLAMKYHPDRQAGKSDTEKKEAEEKFKEISWAYSILSDPEKKQRYDQFGITDDQQMGDGGFDAEDMFSRFANMFGGGGGFESFFSTENNRRHRNRRPDPGQSIRIQIPVSLEDILNGIDRDIEYDIQARCEKCHGVGGEGVSTCPHCNGTGMITETRRTGFGIIQNSHPCQYCNGTGETVSKTCSSCNGTGMKKKSMKVRVNVSPGFANHHHLYFQYKGYESKSESAPSGDLLIEFAYAFNNSNIRIDDNNIYEIIEIPYYDCILGTTTERTLPNNDKVSVRIPEYTSHDKVIFVKKYGNMNYNFVVKVKMPTYVREKEKELLRELKKENG